MSERLKKIITACTAVTLLVFLLALCLLFAYTRVSVRTDDLSMYVEESTDLQLGQLVKEEEGELQTYGGEEQGVICLTLHKGGTEQVMAQMEAMAHFPAENDIVPPFIGYDLAKKLMAEKVTGHYVVEKTGNRMLRIGSKSSYSAELFLSVDKEGEEYLYYFVG